MSNEIKNQDYMYEPLSVSHVEGSNNDDFAVATKKKELRPDDLEAYKKKAEKLIDSYRKFFETFAQDVSLQFRVGDAFYIDYENGIVSTDAKWYAERGYSQTQIIWAHLHELGHFRDFMQDPEGTMANFQHIKGKAQETGKIMMSKWKAAFGEDAEFMEAINQQQAMDPRKPKETMNPVEMAAYKVHHTMYNIFDDIYDNNFVARKAPHYAPNEDGGAEVQKLYKDKLFAKSDYSDLPRHLQFIYALLRDEMVKDEKVIVSDEVRAVLDRESMFHGSPMTAREIIDHYIKPNSGLDNTPSTRNRIIQQTIEPLFEELLMRDIEEWKPEQDPQPNLVSADKGTSGEASDAQAQSSVNPFDKEYKEFDDNNPDQFTDTQFQDWGEKTQDEIKQSKQDTENEANLDQWRSDEERAREEQERLDADWCREKSIKPETLNEFRRIEKSVQPYLDEFSKMWQDIIYGSGRELSRKQQGHFTTGIDLDVQQAINEWPHIASGELDKARIMERIVTAEHLVMKPDLIRGRFIGDVSGSMYEARMNVLKQCFILIMSSLREFNLQLDRTRGQTKSKLHTDTEAWMFGADCANIKQLKSGTGLEDDLASIVQVYQMLDSGNAGRFNTKDGRRFNTGGTYDDKPLEAILRSYTEKDKKLIKSGKIMEIVFEITDGDTMSEHTSRLAIDAMVDMGIIVRGFKITDNTDDYYTDRSAFHTVWNKGREQPLGQDVKDVSELLPAVVESLRKYLRNIRL